VRSPLTIEVGQAVGSLDLLDAELELAESIILGVGLEVTKGGLEHAAHQTILGQTGALRLRHHRLADLTDGEGRRSLHIIPEEREKGTSAESEGGEEESA
jgi:hypothetical protein